MPAERSARLCPLPLHRFFFETNTLYVSASSGLQRLYESSAAIESGP